MQTTPSTDVNQAAQNPTPSDAAQDLARRCADANPHQADSLARRHVALHPADPQGWLILLQSVARNSDGAELARLARLGMQRFPDHPGFRMPLALGLTMCGDPQSARDVLHQAVNNDQVLSIPDATLLAELCIQRDPDLAAQVYEGVLNADPDHATARLGLLSARCSPRLPGRRIRVGLLLTADWHRWILEPVASALAAMGEAFVVTERAATLIESQPDFVVMADPSPLRMVQLRSFLPRTRFVNVRHGVSVNAKNYGLYSAAACDFVCVSSARMGVDIQRLALLPPERIWVTGYPQMDSLWQRVRTESPFAARKSRRVLFAPTFDPQLSAAFLLGDDPVTAIRGTDASICVVLTGHPNLRNSAPQLLATWRNLAESMVNVEYFDSARRNLVDFLPEVDVLVSDISGVATQFLALNRPLIRLFDATTVAGSALDGADPVLDLVSQYALKVKDPAHLANAVAHALQAGTNASNPAHGPLTDYLFGECADGRAGERIAAHLIARMSTP
jgi:hypothetical protein